jgi:hypothetical protein
MKPKMFIHYDAKADFLEIRFGKATPAYYEEIEKDLFLRRDEKTKKVTGYAIFNIQRRKKSVQSLSVPIPSLQS